MKYYVYVVCTGENIEVSDEILYLTKGDSITINKVDYMVRTRTLNYDDKIFELIVEEDI